MSQDDHVNPHVTLGKVIEEWGKEWQQIFITNLKCEILFWRWKKIHSLQKNNYYQ